MRHLIEQQCKSTTALMGKISAISELETLATVGLFNGMRINYHNTVTITEYVYTEFRYLLVHAHIP